jgi:glycogen synthase
VALEKARYVAVRIALLPSAFAPHVGGVEILTDRLARNLVSSGHHVEVWTARTPGDAIADDEQMDGLRIRRFVFAGPRASLGHMARWPMAATKTVAQMNNALRQFRPDVLHVECFGANGVYASGVSALRRVPLVVTLQGETFMDDDDIYEKSIFLRTGLRLGLRRAEVVTGCSRFTLDDAIRRFGLESGKAEVIFNGVDLEEVELSKARSCFDRFVLALGRIEHRKGFDLLIEAWSAVAGRHQGVGLVIGGTGSELSRLRSLVSERRLEDRVHFAGQVSRPEVGALMNAADVFVMPSRVEAFGIVVLEAWRAGTPAIVTANGGTTEFVQDGLTGVVVDPTDARALGDAIERLLTDADLGLRLARAAASRLSDFGWDVIRQQYEVVYETALEDSRRTAELT